jgi:hypothetical protein
MEVIQLLSSTMGLGFVSGLNLYATVLTLGLGIRFHFIALSPQFSKLEILGSWYVLVAAGVLFILEAFADKIPWVDSLWDAIHTLIRPIGAAALGATAIGSVDPQAAVIAAMCGGVALTGHSAKAGTRLLSTTVPNRSATLFSASARISWLSRERGSQPIIQLSCSYWCFCSLSPFFGSRQKHSDSCAWNTPLRLHCSQNCMCLQRVTY